MAASTFKLILDIFWRYAQGYLPHDNLARRVKFRFCVSIVPGNYNQNPDEVQNHFISFLRRTLDELQYWHPDVEAEELATIFLNALGRPIGDSMGESGDINSSPCLNRVASQSLHFLEGGTIFAITRMAFTHTLSGRNEKQVR